MLGLVAKFLVLCGVTAGAYAATPFLAALQLREAIHRGDTKVIETRVQWETVRPSLRHSIAVHAELVPTVPEGTDAFSPPKRISLWQRFKRSVGQRMLDRFMTTYATAEGFVRLHRLVEKRSNGRTLASAGAYGVGRVPTRSGDTWGFLRRIKRLEFLSVTSMALEVAGRHGENRTFAAQFDLVDGTWMLVSLEIRPASAEPVGIVAAVVR